MSSTDTIRRPTSCPRPRTQLTVVSCAPLICLTKEETAQGSAPRRTPRGSTLGPTDQARRHRSWGLTATEVPQACKHGADEGGRHAERTRFRRVPGPHRPRPKRTLPTTGLPSQSRTRCPGRLSSGPGVVLPSGRQQVRVPVGDPQGKHHSTFPSRPCPSLAPPIKRNTIF